jgi:hypothetical protein
VHCRHGWLVDASGRPGRWPTLLVEGRRSEDGSLDARVLYTAPDRMAQGICCVASARRPPQRNTPGHVEEGRLKLGDPNRAEDGDRHAAEHDLEARDLGPLRLADGGHPPQQPGRLNEAVTKVDMMCTTASSDRRDYEADSS